MNRIWDTEGRDKINFKKKPGQDDKMMMVGRDAVPVA